MRREVGVRGILPPAHALTPREKGSPGYLSRGGVLEIENLNTQIPAETIEDMLCMSVIYYEYLSRQ